MPLFECSKCGCIENTACGFYWGQDVPLCSECGPDGQWHGRFDKRSAVGMLIDDGGFLWSQAQVGGGVLPAHYKIVGKVKEKTMKMQAVTSSNIESIGHSGTTLHVRFKHGGTYAYEGVSAEDFKKLSEAKSVGAHLNRMGITGVKVPEKKAE